MAQRGSVAWLRSHNLIHMQLSDPRALSPKPLGCLTCGSDLSDNNPLQGPSMTHFRDALYTYMLSPQLPTAIWGLPTQHTKSVRQGGKWLAVRNPLVVAEVGREPRFPFPGSLVSFWGDREKLIMAYSGEMPQGSSIPGPRFHVTDSAQ